MFENYGRRLRRFSTGFSTILLVAFLVAPQVATAQEAVTTKSGLSYIDTQKGDGAAIKKGQNAVVHYTGWLYENGAKGPKFDSSRDRGRPFTFPLGAGRVIPGWDEGVAGMQPGGQRTLIIPPDLGYGRQGAGGVIPPNATLLFEVELVEAR